MSDLISRADAIEAVDGLKERPQKYYTQYNNALSDAVLELTILPSAKGGDADMTVIPEGTGLMTPCPDNGADFISRADAMEVVAKAKATDPFGRYDKQNIGIDWALEALKALPSGETPTLNEKNQLSEETPTDLISRAEAVNAINKYDFSFPQYMERFVTELRDAMKADLIDDLQNIPSAEAVQGEWIKATGMMPPEFHGHHCCSECGNFANMEPPFGNREDLSKFCPNCGARMVKGGEDE